MFLISFSDHYSIEFPDFWKSSLYVNMQERAFSVSGPTVTSRHIAVE